MQIFNFPINLTINHIKVFKYCVLGGIFIFWFFDAMFFSMLIKEEFEDGVNTVQDLIYRDMELGKYTTYTESRFFSL